MLSFVNITLCLSSASNTSALSYAGGVNIGFTFNPTISLSVSDDLVISNLTPGSSADSNIITVGVATNAAYGYTLTSTVGNENNNTTRNLVNTADNTKTFTSLDFSSSITNKDNLSPNTWGYSYSSDSGTTWANYSGLPLYGDSVHVATLIDTNDAADSDSVQFKIAAKAGATQASGVYTNIVNFYAVAKPKPPYLYDEVEKQSKGTLAANNVSLSDEITKANSGVYEYDPSVYGVSSDASNNKKIYFYRGILDDVTGNYGSDGDGKAYPNYVILSDTGTKATTDTCWRIVRTTGSGGVKMIYNGTWTGITCANATTAAQIRSTAKITAGNTTIFTSPFNGDFSTNRQAVRVGYTYDNNYAANDTTNRTLATLFGTNESDSNTTNSIIKTNIEAWYSNNLSGYTSILETSAGYCGDRTVYDTSNVLQPESLEIPQYSTSTTQYKFGARTRNVTTAQVSSLTCATYDDGITSVNRSKVDLYSTKGSPTGNGRLSKPIALLNADEVFFAGLSRNEGAQGSLYNANSYLRSGNSFWLLSPCWRYSSGGAGVFFLDSSGSNSNDNVDFDFGVRPVISLKLGTYYSDGTGIATDPWIIPAP